MIVQQTVSIDSNYTVEKKEKKSTIIKWKGQEMIRTHSLRASVQEILNMFKSLDVVKVGIIGEPSTGKSTLARDIGHLAHKMQEENKSFPFAFREFGEEQYYDFKATVNALEPANYVLYFHDLTFLVEHKAIEEIKNAVTKIRHLKEGFKAKILLIVDYHYTLGLDKYLRQSDFKFFTSLGSSEMENMESIVGGRFKEKLRDFKQKYVEMKSNQKCTFAFPNHKFFIYNYKNPFVVCLFWNESNLRYVVFPLREWIDPICSICAFATNKLQYSEISVEQFLKEGERKCGERVFKLACKLVLMENGLQVFARSTVSAKKYIMRALEKRQLSLEQIATAYNYKLTKANLKAKLDGILEDNKQETLLDSDTKDSLL